MTCMDADCQNLTGQIVGSPVIADGTYQAIKTTTLELHGSSKKLE